MNNTQNNADYSYLNILFSNPESETKPATFSENRVSPILDRPELFELGVVRFSIPTFSIPIFFFEDGLYNCSLSFQGTTITKDLVYIPNSIGSPFAGKQPVYQYQEFVDSLNIALQESYTDLLAAEPTLPATEPCFMTLEPGTGLSTLYAEDTYLSNLPNPITISFNFKLFEFFAAHENFYVSDEQTNILVKDNYLNSTTFNGKPYFKMTGQYSTLPLWSDFQGIQIRSNSIPVRQELRGEQADVQERIITDFDALSSDINDRTDLQYFADTIRWYDLLSSYPLRRIDLSLFWVSKTGETFPVQLNSLESATVKIAFRKKIQYRLRVREEQNEF